jgi:serine/threonine-protein kinase
MPGDVSVLPSVPPFLEGSVIAGKYRVGRPLGVGAMGVVVGARHEMLGQDVAIKLLLPSLGHDASVVSRFLREAQAAARLRSDHVVRVVDVGLHEGGVPYFVMERLEGHDLSVEMQQRGALPIAEAVDLGMAALAALSEAHSLGMVHRDLKPANLFLASRPDGPPRLKVLDFGISKVSLENEPPGRDLTSTKTLLGSPAYMSPEQIRSSRNVDARSDIWAIGVVLYELLTGQAAFDGETVGDVFAKIREEELPLLGTIRPDVPAPLEAVVARCLRRNRDERYQSAAELRAALAPFASNPAAATVSAAAPVTSSPADVPEPAIGHAGADLGAANPRAATHAGWTSQTGPRAGTRRVALAVTVSLAGLAAAAWFWSTRPPGDDPAANADAAAEARPAAPVVEVASAATAPAPPPPAEPASSLSPEPSSPSPPISAKPRPTQPPPRRVAPAQPPSQRTPSPPPRDELGI